MGEQKKTTDERKGASLRYLCALGQWLVINKSRAPVFDSANADIRDIMVEESHIEILPHIRIAEGTVEPMADISGYVFYIFLLPLGELVYKNGRLLYSHQLGHEAQNNYLLFLSHITGQGKALKADLVAKGSISLEQKEQTERKQRDHSRSRSRSRSRLPSRPRPNEEPTPISQETTGAQTRENTPEEKEAKREKKKRAPSPPLQGESAEELRRLKASKEFQGLGQPQLEARKENVRTSETSEQKQNKEKKKAENKLNPELARSLEEFEHYEADLQPSSSRFLYWEHQIDNRCGIHVLNDMYQENRTNMTKARALVNAHAPADVLAVPDIDQPPNETPSKAPEGLLEEKKKRKTKRSKSRALTTTKRRTKKKAKPKGWQLIPKGGDLAFEAMEFVVQHENDSKNWKWRRLPVPGSWKDVRTYNAFIINTSTVVQTKQGTKRSREHWWLILRIGRYWINMDSTLENGPEEVPEEYLEHAHLLHQNYSQTKTRISVYAMENYPARKFMTAAQRAQADSKIRKRIVPVKFYRPAEDEDKKATETELSSGENPRGPMSSSKTGSGHKEQRRTMAGKSPRIFGGKAPRTV